jgi:hypothetical protein
MLGPKNMSDTTAYIQQRHNKPCLTETSIAPMVIHVLAAVK